ncbi:hypothetical protein MMC17_009688 [Xylographa soralifera]|nr:hypothetical protein [Xylographa soralifera]
MASGIQNLILSLIRCNRRIALEAGSIFYGENTFSFQGEHDWIPIISWLHTIGQRNRCSLTSLRASVSQPKTTWQRTDGTRMMIWKSFQSEYFPRNASFSRLHGAVLEGEVENINPAIETMFSILGRIETGHGGPRLVFTLELNFNLITGVIVLDPLKNEDEERFRAQMQHFSMDMPSLVEKWRVEYTAPQGYRPIEVLWKVESERLLVKEKGALIKKRE